MRDFFYAFGWCVIVSAIAQGIGELAAVAVGLLFWLGFCLLRAMAED